MTKEIWRCLNDEFRYCDGEPDFGKKLYPFGGSTFYLHTCRSNPKVCGKCRTLSQLLEGRTLPTSRYVVKKGRVVKVKCPDD
jgi:hypothetical protein